MDWVGRNRSGRRGRRRGFRQRRFGLGRLGCGGRRRRRRHRRRAALSDREGDLGFALARGCGLGWRRGRRFCADGRSSGWFHRKHGRGECGLLDWSTHEGAGGRAAGGRCVGLSRRGRGWGRRLGCSRGRLRRLIFPLGFGAEAQAWRCGPVLVWSWLVSWRRCFLGRGLLGGIVLAAQGKAWLLRRATLRTSRIW